MKAGRELDALVAEKVMGWRPFPYQMPGEAPGGTRVYCRPDGPIHISNTAIVPGYSTDIAAAWPVVEKLRQRENSYAVHVAVTVPVTVDVVDWRDGTGTVVAATADAETAPHAICLAALRAVGAEVPT